MNFQNYMANNPIYQIGNQVVEGSVSMTDACSLVTSHAFLVTLDSSHLETLLTLVTDILESDPTLARIYSQLNILCSASLSVEAPLKAAIFDINGLVLQQLGNYQESLHYLNVARQLYLELKELRSAALCDMSLGDAFAAQNEIEKASEHYSQARTYFVQEKMEEQVVWCEQAIARISKNADRPHRTSDYDLVLSTIADEQGIDNSLRESYMKLGQTCTELKRWNDAFKLYEVAKQQFEKVGMMRHVAECTKHMILSCVELDHYEEAIALCTATREILEREHLLWDLALCDYMAATAYRALGDVESSVRKFLSAKDLFEKEELIEDVARCDSELAVGYLSLELPDEALQHYSAAKESPAANEIMDRLELLDFGFAVYSAKSGDPEEALKRCFAQRNVNIADCDSKYPQLATLIALSLVELGGVDYLVPYLGDSQNVLDYCNLVLEVMDQSVMSHAKPALEELVGDKCIQEDLWEKANEYYTAANKLFRDQDMWARAIMCELKIADSYRQLDNVEEAINHLHEALKICHENELRHTEAAVNDLVGLELGRLQRLEQAIDYYLLAHQLYDQEGMTKEAAQSHKRIADAYYRLDRFKEAFDHYRACVIEFNQIDSWQEAAECNVNIGATLSHMEEPEAAIEYYLAARALYDMANMLEPAGRCEMSVGYLTHQLGQHERAIVHYQKAIASFDQIDLFETMASCYDTIATINLDLKLPAQALQAYLKAAQLFQDGESWNDLADCQCNIAAIYGMLGQLDKAIESGRAARMIYEREHIIAGLVPCLQNLGQAFTDLDRLEEAIECYDSCKILMIETENDQESAHCEVKVARLLLRLEREEEALAYYSSARSRLTEHHPLELIAECEMNMAMLNRNKGELERAIDFFTSAIENLDRLGLKYEQGRCALLRALIHVELHALDCASDSYILSKKIFEEEGMIQEVQLSTSMMVKVLFEHEHLDSAVSYLLMLLNMELEDTLQADALRLGIAVLDACRKCDKPDLTIILSWYVLKLSLSHRFRWIKQLYRTARSRLAAMRTQKVP